MNRRTIVLRLAVAVAVAVVAAGCDSERLARMAEQSTREQSAQNQRLSQAHGSLTEGSRQLVEADAHARRDLAQRQDELRQDQAQVNKQRDALEAERKTIALERRQDSWCSSNLNNPASSVTPERGAPWQSKRFLFCLIRSWFCR
jgi:septal ring factor EnvC (AmiA/AmiB activator)